MFSIEKKRTAKIAKAILGVSILIGMSVGVSATEYRLFVNDTTACRTAGITGSVCLVPLGSTTASTVTAAPSATTTQAASASNSGSGCVPTSWNPCTASNAISPVTSAPAATSSTSSSTAAPPPAAPAYVPSGSVSSGDLNYGSGGGNATGNRSRLTVTNDTTAFPFTVAPGNFFGSVSVTTTSSPFPTDGTQVRVWWSSTAGGSPLPGSCASNIGRAGKLYWDQTGTLGYGCDIPNASAKLYLNLRSCISAPGDRTCSSSKSPGSPASLYIMANKGTR
jgi:hypothetical protein